MIRKRIKLRDLRPNRGQIEGLPSNPRFIRNREFSRLVESVREMPDVTEARDLIVFPHDGAFVVIGGNMRLRAYGELGWKDCQCCVLPEDTPAEKLRRIAMIDNKSYGEFDWETLDAEWDTAELSEWGVVEDWDGEGDEDAVPERTPEPVDGAPLPEAELELSDTDGFEGKLEGDVVYASDNPFEIPTLRMDRQAGNVELPLSPWGANSRQKTDVATYHFYVDDYRFNQIFQDPSKLIASRCKAIVEPNCSIHDMTPVAWGLCQIYKKRYIARFCQEAGMKVYADLNVSPKFAEYNKMGIPKGYNAFATRGTMGRMELLDGDLRVARDISGLDNPNLFVYGGGDEARRWCERHNLLFVADFMNGRKD